MLVVCASEGIPCSTYMYSHNVNLVGFWFLQLTQLCTLLDHWMHTVKINSYFGNIKLLVNYVCTKKYVWTSKWKYMYVCMYVCMYIHTYMHTYLPSKVLARYVVLHWILTVYHIPELCCLVRCLRSSLCRIVCGLAESYCYVIRCRHAMNSLQMGEADLLESNCDSSTADLLPCSHTCHWEVM